MTQSAAAPSDEPVHAAHPSPIAAFSAWLKRDNNGIVLAASALYVLIYALFWPVLYSTMDEASYMNTAYAVAHGTIYLDVAHTAPIQAYAVGPHVISQYPPGMAFLLAPFGLLGWNVALGFNLIVHLTLFWIIAALLRLNKTPTVFALLYLLHPVAALFSRTVMSDLASSLILTLSFVATLKRRYFLCGVLIGLAIFVRTASAVAAAFFGIGILLEGTRFFRADDAAVPTPLAERIRRIVAMGLGVLPFFIVAYLYQKIIQDGGWAKYAQPGMLSVRHLPVQFPFYTIALLALYPGMLLAPLLYKGPGRATLLCYVAGFFAFYCIYYFHDEGGSKLETFLVGQRFMLVILPLMLVSYSRLVWELLGKKIPFAAQRALVAAAVLLLFVGAGLIHRRHAAYLATLAQIRQTALQAVPPGGALFCNVHMAKLLRPGAATAHLQLLPNSGNEASDAQTAENMVRMTLQKTGGPVTVAIWSRAYRPETPHEMAVFHALETKFGSASKSQNSDSLPTDVHILQIDAQAKP